MGAGREPAGQVARGGKLVRDAGVREGEGEGLGVGEEEGLGLGVMEGEGLGGIQANPGAALRTRP